MMTEKQVVNMLAMKVDKWSRHGMNQSDLAQKLGVTDAFLSMVLKGQKKPSRRILRYLRVRKVVGYDYLIPCKER